MSPLVSTHTSSVPTRHQRRPGPAPNSSQNTNGSSTSDISDTIVIGPAHPRLLAMMRPPARGRQIPPPKAGSQHLRMRRCDWPQPLHQRHLPRCRHMNTRRHHLRSRILLLQQRLLLTRRNPRHRRRPMRQQTHLR
ncbi:hypothetical protein RHA1_ro08216 (plasmid) [Rhodococcus jostii RHA1]|uniref:Uncharacterized protein n=1 Tax=Rhodococcus jostii (strain RHA1) TaxID=101510 RepID=Q0RZM5_RHOJR|nr:hypothetical protein RHA1_ro08216 [Rhodococcus jostii RHA1]